jgi:hypothetical protein
VSQEDYVLVAALLASSGELVDARHEPGVEVGATEGVHSGDALLRLTADGVGGEGGEREEQVCLVVEVDDGHTIVRREPIDEPAGRLLALAPGVVAEKEEPAHAARGVERDHDVGVRLRSVTQGDETIDRLPGQSTQEAARRS